MRALATVPGWVLLAVFGLFCLSPILAQAAVTVSAEISPQKVGLGEPLEYRVTVIGAGRGSATPNLPDLPDMELAGTGSSTKFQSINGQISRSAVFSYTLIPGRVGLITIPGTTVTVKGVDYTSNTVSVEVMPVSNRSRAQSSRSGARYPYGGGALQEGDVTIDTQVDNPTPYVGEAIILTFSFDRAVELSRVAYTPAPHTGFRSVELDFPPGGDKHDYFKSGRRRIVQERKMALFALQPGAATIGPASIDFSVTPFSGGQRLLTEPISIQVKPLPSAGRPADFSGLVGSAGLSATLTPETGQVGESLTLTLTVAGRGNLHDVTAPVVADSGDFQVYAPEVSEQINHGLNGVSGSRTFRYVLIPRRAGDLTLGEVSLSLFNPKTAEYQTLTAGPFTVPVRPAPVSAAPVTSAPAASVAPIQADIGMLDAVGGAAADGAAVKSRNLLQNMSGWLQGMVLFAVLLLIRRWYRRRSAGEAGHASADGAVGLSDDMADRLAPVVAARVPPPVPTSDMASIEVALASALALEDDDACLTALSRALHRGIGACLAVPEGQVDTALLGDRLVDAPELRQQAQALLADLDQARFAPGMGGVERGTAGVRIQQLLGELMRAYPPLPRGR